MDNLIYAFTNFKEINLSIREYEIYNLNNNKFMIDIYKYLKWRRINLLLLLPLLFCNFVLNILNFKYIENTIDDYDINHNYTLKNNIEYFGNDYNSNKNNDDFVLNNYNLANKNKTMGFLKFYYIFCGIIIFTKMILVGVSYLHNYIFLKSRICMNICLVISVSWIYLVYINPINYFFKLNTANDYYSKSYLLINLLKEIIPISTTLFISAMWSFRNLKVIIPNNIILGWFYEYSLYFFIITGGTLLLCVNQFIDNYYISVCIGIYIISLFIGLFIYKKDLQIFYSREECGDIIQYNFNVDFIINIGLILIFVLSVIYICKYDLYFDDGIYKISIIDYIQFMIKYIFNILFFRIIICDNTLSFLLYIEKYKLLVKTELENYNQKMVNIESKLYNNYITTMNIHNGYNSLNND